ncbi:MAG: hypothetical protein HKN78_09715 [Sphingomonadaceae bacterium]|nr:hypothetical protein [Sphingomonadaceae bacterium]
MVGRVQALDEERTRMIAAIDHLDCSIRLFEPDIDFDDMPVKLLPPANAAFRGEFSRFLIETLRAARDWRTTDQLNEKVMVQRRLNETDNALRVLSRKRVGHALSRLRKRGVVVSQKRGKGPLLSWRLVRPDVQLQEGWRNGATARDS